MALCHSHGVLSPLKSSPRPLRFKRVVCKAERKGELVQPSSADAVAHAFKRRQVLGAAATVAAGAFVCPCCGPSPANAAAWGYDDVSGPANWGGVCKGGVRQSPVNLPLEGDQKVKLVPTGFDFQYRPAEIVRLLNTGHGTMQVNFPSGLSVATVNGRRLRLLQFHFHSPSEHAFGGTRTAMEAHLVHKDLETGGLAVVGVMMLPGGRYLNPALELALDYAPRNHGVEAGCPRPVSALDLLPPPRYGTKERPFVHYQGSLTTPPCTEGVEWYVFMDPLIITDKQCLDFMNFVGDGVSYGQNSRPLQQLGERNLDYRIV